MHACSRLPALLLALITAAPVPAQEWRVESQQGDVIALVPLPAGPAGADTPVRFLCLRDLAGGGGKGLGLGEERPQVVTRGTEMACIATATRPQTLRLWRIEAGAAREVLRLPLRAEDLGGRGLRIDWLRD